MPLSYLNDIATLLKNGNLRTTDCRKRILECFINHKFALSQGFLEHDLHQEFDRVTIYRTLKAFLDGGLIHKILDDEGGIKYALCSGDCSSSLHNHSHVHFKCERCGQTICLEKVAVPDVNIPNEFLVGEINVLVSGVCSNCK